MFGGFIVIVLASIYYSGGVATVDDVRTLPDRSHAIPAVISMANAATPKQVRLTTFPPKPPVAKPTPFPSSVPQPPFPICYVCQNKSLTVGNPDLVVVPLDGLEPAPCATIYNNGLNRLIDPMYCTSIQDRVRALCNCTLPVPTSVLAPTFVPISVRAAQASSTPCNVCNNPDLEVGNIYGTIESLGLPDGISCLALQYAGWAETLNETFCRMAQDAVVKNCNCTLLRVHAPTTIAPAVVVPTSPPAVPSVVSPTQPPVIPFDPYPFAGFPVCYKCKNSSAQAWALFWDVYWAPGNRSLACADPKQQRFGGFLDPAYCALVKSRFEICNCFSGSVPGVSLGFPTCHVCKNSSLVVGDPYRTLTLPGHIPTPCLELQNAGLGGFLDPMVCPSVQDHVVQFCNCMVPIPTLAPTVAPTFSPVVAPTFAPVPTFPPVVAPTFPPVHPTFPPTSTPPIPPFVTPPPVPTFAPTNSPTFDAQACDPPQCAVCRDPNQVVGNVYATVISVGPFLVSCLALQFAGRAGAFNESFCHRVQNAVEVNCNCVFPSVNSPTQPPVTEFPVCYQCQNSSARATLFVDAPYANILCKPSYPFYRDAYFGGFLDPAYCSLTQNRVEICNRYSGGVPSLTASLQYPTCHVCRNSSLVVGDPYLTLKLAGLLPTPCLELQNAGLQGFLDPWFCPHVQNQVLQVCNCSLPNPTLAPTVAPTFAPHPPVVPPTVAPAHLAQPQRPVGPPTLKPTFAVVPPVAFPTFPPAVYTPTYPPFLYLPVPTLKPIGDPTLPPVVPTCGPKMPTQEPVTKTPVSSPIVTPTLPPTLPTTTGPITTPTLAPFAPVPTQEPVTVKPVSSPIVATTLPPVSPTSGPITTPTLAPFAPVPTRGPVTVKPVSSPAPSIRGSLVLSKKTRPKDNNGMVKLASRRGGAGGRSTRL